MTTTKRGWPSLEEEGCDPHVGPAARQGQEGQGSVCEPPTTLSSGLAGEL